MYIPKEIMFVAFIIKALQFYRICHVCYTGWDIVPDLWIIVLKSGHQVFLRGRGSLWCFQFCSWLFAGQLFAVNDGTKMKNKSKVFSFCICFFGGLQPLSFEISLHSAGDGKERSREIGTTEGTLQQAHWEAQQLLTMWPCQGGDVCTGRASVQRGGGILDPLACPGEGRHSLKMSKANMFSLGWFVVIDLITQHY